jgi:hypothetical protein
MSTSFAGPGDQRVHAIDPLQLVSPSRLDLVCKYLYFRELAASTDRDAAQDPSFAARLYEKHIVRRTGGIEPADPFQSAPGAGDKQSVADYLHHARLLLASLQTNGFDPNAAVTYFPNGTLGNGAHRISAALALGKPVFAKRQEGRGTAWPFAWFVDNGFTVEELQTLLYSYTHLKADAVAVFVFYSPARPFWDAFQQAVSQAFYVVGQVDVSPGTQLGIYELIHDLYGTLQPLSSTDVINRKALLLAMSPPFAVRVVVAERKDAGDDLYSVATTTKTRCRDLARDIVAPESFLSAHAGSSKTETLNLARALLSPNNLRQLSRRRSVGVRAVFGEWLAECRAACARSSIALDDICIVGSSPLEVIGVRPSTDVDFTVKSVYRKQRYGSGVTHLAPAVDIVTEGYHRSRERAAISDDDMIETPDHHFMFRGFKFANPEIVLDQKQFYRRDKDVRDVEAARAVSLGDPVPFDPAVAFAACSETLFRELTAGTPVGTPSTVPAPPRSELSTLARLRQLVPSRLRALARRVRQFKSG